MNTIIACLSLLCCLLGGVAVTTVGAAEAPPGMGTLHVNGKPIQLVAGFALLHDNAEGLLDYPTELRILLVDRKVDEKTLQGIGYLEIARMAEQGKVQGVMISMDPNDPGTMRLGYLYPPKPEKTLTRKKFNTPGEKVFEELVISDKRVKGKLADRDNPDELAPEDDRFDVAVSFDLPLLHEPAVTENLAGEEARKSPIMALFRRKAEALVRGDIETLRKIAGANGTKSLEAFLANVGDRAAPILKETGTAVQQSLDKVDRIVVRGDRAIVLIGDGEWVSFVKEAGQWKTDD
jgi:hypothetical protein